jgi:hypothetical protein
MIGGTQRELQYIGDVRTLFDAFYKNPVTGQSLLPGNAITPVATPLTVAQAQELVNRVVVPAVLQNPFGMYAIASTAQTPLAFVPGNLANPADPTFRNAFMSMLNSLGTALVYQLVGTPDVLDRTHDHSPYGNVGVKYTLGTPVIPALATVLGGAIAGANATVARFEMSDEAREYFTKYYQPTGRVAIPTLTIHNVFDPLVPFFHETDFAGIVGADGASMLLQRAVPNYAHCTFDKSLIVNGVVDLDSWATSGVRPAR